MLLKLYNGLYYIIFYDILSIFDFLSTQKQPLQIKFIKTCWNYLITVYKHNDCSAPERPDDWYIDVSLLKIDFTKKWLKNYDPNIF